MYIALIDTEERTLTLKEERPDPFEGGEMREVEINTYSLNGHPLETAIQTRSIALDEDGKVRLTMEADTLTSFGQNQTDGFWNEVEDELGIEHTSDGVQLNENKNAADNYRDFLEFLHEKGFLTQDDLPVGRSNARSRHLVNSEPTHRSSEMSRPYEVAEGIFAEANLSSDDIKRNIRELGEQLVDD